MEGSLVLAAVNIGLAIALLALYRRVYRQTRAEFTLALIVFALAFLLQNLLVLYSYSASMPLIPDSLAPFLFGIGGCEAAGLGAIVWTATR